MTEEMEKLRVLITVKTYPIPSSKYDELVCTAGVTETGDFIRLYPINFRDQPFSQQYKKYQWVEVMALKYQSRDARKESYRPDCDTLKILGERIPTKKGDWSERAKYALAKKSRSMEQLHEQQRIDKTSLGVFKPKKVFDLEIKPDDPNWKSGFINECRQTRLWETRKASKEPPRKIPYKFYYKFECDDPSCKGRHRMMIEDWEVGALFWNCVDAGDAHEIAAQKVKDKFLGEICGPEKDTHFFVGNLLRYPTSWVVIGVFWPTITSRKDRMPSLFNI